jgi:hypothetical protein
MVSKDVRTAMMFFKGAGFHMRDPLEQPYDKGDLHFVTFSRPHCRPLLGTPQPHDCFVKPLIAFALDMESA